MATNKHQTATSIRGFLATGFDFDSSTTYQELIHATNGLVRDANHLGSITAVSPVGTSPSVVEYGIYGEDASRRIAGQQSSNDITINLAYAGTEAGISTVNGLRNDEALTFAMEIDTGGTNTIDIVVINGRFASKQFTTGLGQVSTLDITISPEGQFRIVPYAT